MNLYSEAQPGNIITPLNAKPAAASSICDALLFVKTVRGLGPAFDSAAWRRFCFTVRRNPDPQEPPFNEHARLND